MSVAADNIYGQGNWDNPTGQRAVVPFRFATNNFANGVAARVYVVDEQATSTNVQSNQPITQAKRSVAMNGTLTGPGMTVQQLEAYAQAGMAREILIHENLTVRSHLSSSNNRISPSEYRLPSTKESIFYHSISRVVLIHRCVRSPERTQTSWDRAWRCYLSQAFLAQAYRSIGTSERLSP
jgi:hypothetical protein